jgi:hypothetical protein
MFKEGLPTIVFASTIHRGEPVERRGHCAVVIHSFLVLPQGSTGGKQIQMVLLAPPTA